MKATELHEAAAGRSFALVFETGDEVVETLSAFAERQRLGASYFTAVGAFSDVVVAYLDWTTRQYERLPIAEQVEVLSLNGDITLHDGAPKIHAHVVVGKRDATAHGGHLVSAHVRPTLELVLIETRRTLRRRFGPAAGLALIDPTA